MSHLPPPTALPPGSIVDLYVRDSGGPRQEASTDQQIAEITAYCQQHNLILRHKFIDAAKSGGSTVGRDEFNRLIDTTRLPENRPRAVLLWNYARFARDLDDAIYYKALLRNREIIVHSLTDPIPEGQYGRIIEFFIDISNEEKRRQTSVDAKRGLHELVTLHKCVPGTPPRGFKRQPVEIGTRRDGSPRIAHRWVPDPDFTPRIQRAFAMRATGSTLAQIHKEIKLFASLNSYKTFFTNKLYIGILEFGELVLPEYCQPMIDMETWNAVQKLILDYARDRTVERHPRRHASPYLLSGLVYCEFCGAPMFGNTATHHHVTGKRDEAYRCSRARRKRDCSAPRIPRRILEEAVIHTLSKYVLHPDTLAASLQMERTATDHRETRRAERLAILETERKTLASQIANVTRAIAERSASKALLEKLTQLESQQALILAEHADLTKLRFHPIPPLTMPEIERASQYLIELLNSAPRETVRQIFQVFIHKITAKKQEKKVSGFITYYVPPLPQLLNHVHDTPPFDLAPTDEYLPISRSPVGAPSKKSSSGDFFCFQTLSPLRG